MTTQTDRVLLDTNVLVDAMNAGRSNELKSPTVGLHIVAKARQLQKSAKFEPHIGVIGDHWKHRGFIAFAPLRQVGLPVALAAG